MAPHQKNNFGNKPLLWRESDKKYIHNRILPILNTGSVIFTFLFIIITILTIWFLGELPFALSTPIIIIFSGFVFVPGGIIASSMYINKTLNNNDKSLSLFVFETFEAFSLSWLYLLKPTLN